MDVLVAGGTISFFYLVGILGFFCLFPAPVAAAGIDYASYEERCVANGWQRMVVSVSGIDRKILWKAPPEVWNNGAILVFHGGGGSATNWCSGVPAAKPCIEFSDLALREGFAVFALDSADGIFIDDEGNTCGKRFICTAQRPEENQDLEFIKSVINDIIPSLRSLKSAPDIFIAGISNGGFMTILAATHFDDKITAFVPVSAGDPYGTYIDCHKDLSIRQAAPGLFYDSQTKLNIGEDNACLAVVYPNEKEWSTASPARKPAFKQFHNEGDAGVDISCMKKAQTLLVGHGYRDDGPFLVKNTGKKRLWKHFWAREYNRPILEFFKKCRRLK
ncbi:MAG: hypothetical protein WDL87_10590 [Candidatus Omnitrophota bacterium]|jgi:pimeloyl-ACP methyl ester carboxylesterase